MWLRSLIREIQSFDLLDHTDSTSAPTWIMEDNTAAAQWASNPISHARQRHIDIAHHAIRDWVANRDIEVKYVPTISKLAYVVTKSRPPATFHQLTGIFTGKRSARETLQAVNDKPVDSNVIVQPG